MLFQRLLGRVKNQKEVHFVLLTLAITVGVAFTSALLHLTWRSAFVLAFGMYGLLLWFAFRHNDGFLKRLLVFGLAAGFTELLADCWLVQSTGTLIYPNNEPGIACSPLYMPFAWAVLLIQIGYLGWLISQSEQLWVSILATFVIGCAVIPLFEHWAKGAGWWYYVNCRMLGNTPYYIIFAEGLICSFMPVLFKAMHQRHYMWQLPVGIVQGLWIWVSYYIGFMLFR